MHSIQYTPVLIKIYTPISIRIHYNFKNTLSTLPFSDIGGEKINLFWIFLLRLFYSNSYSLYRGQ